MNYYPHHIGDFRSGTANMKRLERWLYRDMIDVYYDKEQELPLDTSHICDLIGADTDEEVIAVEKILRLKFTKTATGWAHMRCETELEAYRAKAEIAKENGAKGGRPPKNNQEITQRVSTGFLSGSYPQPSGNPAETGSKANQEPITNNHKPRTNNQEPRTSELQKPNQQQPLASPVGVAAKKSVAEEPNPLNLETWQAYRQAYTERYRVPPIRDAPTNSKIKAVVKGLGKDAPLVAAFFVRHNGARYASGMHQIGLLASDYAKLHTEWATGTQMTHTKAMQADKTLTNFDAFAPLLAEAEARERANAQQ